MNVKKIIAGVLTYIVIFAIYLAFFSYPVTPAHIYHMGYIDVETKNLSKLPQGVYKVYVRGSITPAIVVIATIRTPYVPSSSYSYSLKYTKGIAENEIKKRYHVNILLVYKGERKVEIQNHEVVMELYDVHLNYTSSVPPLPSLKPKIIQLTIGAYFCQEKFESIIIAYAYPPEFASDFNGVLSSIQC